MHQLVARILAISCSLTHVSHGAVSMAAPVWLLLLLSGSEACKRHEYYPGASGRGQLEVPTCHHVTAGWAIVTTSTAHGKVSGRTPTLRQGGSATAAPLRQSLPLVGGLARPRPTNYRFSNPRLDNDALRRDAGRGATTALQPVPLPSPTTVMFDFQTKLTSTDKSRQPLRHGVRQLGHLSCRRNNGRTLLVRLE